MNDVVVLVLNIDVVEFGGLPSYLVFFTFFITLILIGICRNWLSFNICVSLAYSELTRWRFFTLLSMDLRLGRSSLCDVVCWWYHVSRRFTSCSRTSLLSSTSVDFSGHHWLRSSQLLRHLRTLRAFSHWFHWLLCFLFIFYNLDFFSSFNTLCNS